MTTPVQPANPSAARAHLSRARLPHTQHGVVLIVSLILLVVISMLAVTSIRNAGLSESMAGNVRTTKLATEAAEIALRYCESKALVIATSGVALASAPEQWKNLEAWDGSNSSSTWATTSNSAYVLPLALVNQSGMAITTYQRSPECMVEKETVVTIGTSTFYVITARGFGPEVIPVTSARARPQGTEVWLQSFIQIGTS